MVRALNSKEAPQNLCVCRLFKVECHMPKITWQLNFKHCNHTKLQTIHKLLPPVWEARNQYNRWLQEVVRNGFILSVLLDETWFTSSGKVNSQNKQHQKFWKFPSSLHEVSLVSGMCTRNHGSCALQEKTSMFSHNSTTILQGINREEIYIYFKHHTDTVHTTIY